MFCNVPPFRANLSEWPNFTKAKEKVDYVTLEHTTFDVQVF